MAALPTPWCRGGPPCFTPAAGTIDLTSNKLSGVDNGGKGTHNMKAVSALFEAIKKASSLAEVDLSFNNLAGEFGPISAFNTKNCNVSSRSGDPKNILVGDRANYEGRALTVTGSTANGDDFKIMVSDLSVVKLIGEAICGNDKLTSFTMSNNGLGPDGKRDLGKMIKQREADGLTAKY